MSNYRDPAETEQIQKKVLMVSANLFLQNGFYRTTIQEIADEAHLSKSILMYMFKSKEDILCKLVGYVLDGQFSMTKKFLEGKTEDKILFYAAETTLQLYMAESSESVRDLYAAAYSLPKTSDMIQHTITGKLEVIFREHLPHLETKDFYELEIASGGIMRGFMARPCDMYFTMQRKVRRFLETTFLVYQVPREKIEEAIAFVSQFDYDALALAAIDSLLRYLSVQMQ